MMKKENSKPANVFNQIIKHIKAVKVSLYLDEKQLVILSNFVKILNMTNPLDFKLKNLQIRLLSHTKTHSRAFI